VTRCAASAHRAAEANRITAVLAVPCLLALVSEVWPAAGAVIGWAVGIALGLLLVVAVGVRRVRSAREVARRSR
jgi:hypothetical protein